MLVMSHDFMTKPLRVSPDLQAEAVSDVFNECDVNNDDNDASIKIKYEIELKSRYAKFIRKNLTRVQLCGCHASRRRTKLIQPAYIIDHISAVYKNLNHRIDHSNFILSRDVETNPGPVNPANTIKAPCSQDNALLFGSNSVCSHVSNIIDI